MDAKPRRKVELPQMTGTFPRIITIVVAKMATPKGMRLIQLPVNSTDAVHVYSSDRHIWLQIRRAVPTERDIGRSSFKVALSLTPGTAHKLGLELLNLAERNKDKPKAKAGARQPADEKGAKSN